MKRQWNLDEEIRLFSLVCDYKPAGEKKEENMAQIVVHINKNNHEPFTPEQIWEKLAQYYDLEKADEIENEEDNEHYVGLDADQEQLPEPTTVVKTETKEVKVEAEDHDLAIDSSELSDVEGDEAELAKLDEKPLLPVEETHKKGRRKSTAKKVGDNKEKKVEENKEKKAEDNREKTVEDNRDGSGKEIDKDKSEKQEPGLRKRTRQVAKLDTVESSPKRRQLRASTPPATKRRTRSELAPEDERADEDNENEEEEPEPKTRRSTRKATRRSVRKR